MKKAELRKFYLQERLSIKEKDLQQHNIDICENFFSEFGLKDIKVLHTFLPMENTNEPDTWIIINKVRKHFPHIRISIPKINVSSIEVENFFLEDLEQLKLNPWGILEPEYGERTKTEDIDMVLVPMVIADQYGNRVGYGKGFYDKFLATCRPSCVTIGLCFYDPITRIDDVNALDVPLKYCATPTTVHRF